MLVRTLLRTAFTSLLLSTTQCPISPSSFIPSRHSFRGINPWPVSLNEFFVVDNQVGMMKEQGRGVQAMLAGERARGKKKDRTCFLLSEFMEGFFSSFSNKH